jgi:hypothetical protein
MGWWDSVKSVGSKILDLGGSALRKVGELGSSALSAVGNLPGLYAKVNDATGGLIGRTLENLPVIGPAVKSVSSMLNGGYGLVNGLKSGVAAISGFGNTLGDASKTLKES